MIRLQGFFLLILLACSGVASAAGLEFVGRCEISLPLLNVSLDAEPAQLLACREKNGRPELYFTQPLSLYVGDQKYSALPEWLGVGEKCPDALKAFQERPEMFFADPIIGDFRMLVNFDSKYQKFRLSRGNIAACLGKRTR